MLCEKELNNSYKGTQYVLILVLMEYALREVNHKSYFQTTHKASEPHSHFKKVII